MAERNSFKLLLIEDNPGDARLIQEMLREDRVYSFSVIQKETLAEALQALNDRDFDIILLDLNLPDSQGEHTFSSINNAYPDAPIVILTGNDDQQAAFSAIGLGAQDYLVKGTFHNGLLTRAILYAIERKRLQNMISHLALHDALTGLPNRRLLMEYLEHDIKMADRESNLLAVLMLDLDNFKHINDQYGHHIGDHVLVEVAHRLQFLLRKCDVIARIGGDEFVVPVAGIKEPGQAEAVAKKIIDAFKEPIIVDNARYSISFSIGIALYPTQSQNAKELFKNADQAMYTAKEDGKGRYHLYKQD